MPNQVGGDLLHTMDESSLSRVRTQLQSLLIIAFLTPHPVEADGQFACHRNLSDATVATHGQYARSDVASRGPSGQQPGLPPPVESSTENFLVW
jgi:hypothetical protein